MISYPVFHPHKGTQPAEYFTDTNVTLFEVFGSGTKKPLIQGF